MIKTMFHGEGKVSAAILREFKERVLAKLSSYENQQVYSEVIRLNNKVYKIRLEYFKDHQFEQVDIRDCTLL